jgi:hypothetical protein
LGAEGRRAERPQPARHENPDARRRIAGDCTKHSTPLEEATTSSVDALKATEATAEFQEILDQPGVVLGDPIGAVARLQLARALTQAVDLTKASSVYADLLALWKDADADCILHSAFCILHSAFCIQV